MCPRCRQPLVAFELEGVEIDRCIRCGGTWLDAGELEWIAERAGVEPGPLSAALHARTGGRRSSRKCPRCGRRTETVTVGENPPVGLDRCRHGHGLWFDAGEMERVVASFAGGEEGAVADFFRDLYRYDVRSPIEGV